MIEFYSPDIAESNLLPPEESFHCCKVLRMKAGDAVCVVDGRGHRYNCELIDADPRNARLSIIEEIEERKPWQPSITLCVAPTKNIDRIEWMLEKCVEIGVDKIYLLQCARSERRKVNEERLSKIILSAMKQSLKSRLPEWGGLIPFNQLLKETKDFNGLKAFGYCDSTMERRRFVEEYKAPEDAVLLIGPEGDFSGEEVKLAMDNGYLPVTFGSSRLRTETAALYGVEAIHILCDIRKG